MGPLYLGESRCTSTEKKLIVIIRITNTIICRKFSLVMQFGPPTTLWKSFYSHFTEAERFLITGAKFQIQSKE